MTETLRLVLLYLTDHLLTIGLIGASLAFLYATSILSLHPQEPPPSHLRVPFLGCLLGLIRHGARFLDVLGASSPEPIFTIDFFFHRIYIITSPSLIVSAQNSRSLSTNPTFVSLTSSYSGFDNRSYGILSKDTDNRTAPSYLSDVHKLAVPMLSAKPGFTIMSQTFLGQFAGVWDSLGKQQDKPVELWDWLCHSFTVGNGAALWGSRCPYLIDANLWVDFWTMEAAAAYIVYNILPNLLARKAVQAQQRVIAAFTKYHEAGYGLDDDVSPFVRERCRIARQYGFNNHDLGGLEASLTVGLVMNTVPVAHAVLGYICRDKALLADIRKELDALVERRDLPNYEPELTFHAHSIRQKCPLFLSTTYETMRLISSGATVRTVMEDVVIGSSKGDSDSGRPSGYLLRKNSTVYLAGGIIHNTPSYWEPSTDLNFNARRFLGIDAPERSMPGKWRAFGGGSSICGGRHLAIAEVLAAVGGILVRYEMEPVGGKWVIPRREDTTLYSGIPKPAGRLELMVRDRETFRGQWIFCAGTEE